MFAQNFLGIGDAKALSVHLANLRVTTDRMRRWTGFAVALTVTFTVCDAQQIGFSPSGGLVFPTKTLAYLRTVLPEQKAPPTLAPLRLTNESLVSRKQPSGTVPATDVSRCFRYALVSLGQLDPLCPQINSEQNTRGPPRMDPPTLS
jgi:hypothetical protein